MAMEEPKKARHWSQDDPEHKLGPQAILERKYVKELVELVELRKKGWDEDQLDTHFASQRRSADKQDESQNQYWYKTMKSVMRELDKAAYRFVPSYTTRTYSTDTYEFLDIGCSPGGFSGYVLEKNSDASGVGISLPPSMGGYPSSLESKYRRRYELIEQDLLLYELHKEPTLDSSQALPSDFHCRFSLVMLDAHALRSYSAALGQDSEECRVAHAAYRDTLLITQFIIALSCIRPGGTIVAKLSHLECSPAAHLVYLLDHISRSLVLHKPRYTHSNRGTFYAIAEGVGKGGEGVTATMARYLEGLRDLWRKLRCGGEDGQGTYLRTTDLDFVVTADAILDEYVDRLVKLGRGVWATQVAGLRFFFRKKGIPC